MEKPVKEVMCVGQQSLMQKALAPLKERDSDVVSYSTDTSRWSTPSNLYCGPDSPQYSSDCVKEANSVTDTLPEMKTTDKFQGSKSPGRKKDKKAQGDYKHNTKYSTHCHIQKLSFIKSAQVSNPRLQSARLNCMNGLKNQVRDLQQQLNEAQTENKVLKTLQHRHMVALQHFQSSEGSISQILTKHKNEVRVLQGLLRETRTCRDHLARKLQATENKLLNTKTALQHLQLLSQDSSLLEREELTLMLAKATAELEKKGKKILDLEKNLELCQASFSRQLVTERRKLSDARKISCHLQEQIYQLNKEIQDRQQRLTTHNIYSHRVLKGSTKKTIQTYDGNDSQTVESLGLVALPTEAATALQFKYLKAEEKLEEQENTLNLCCYDAEYECLKTKKMLQRTEDAANVTSEEYLTKDTEIYADTREQNCCFEKSPEYQNEGACAEEKEVSEAAAGSEEEQKTKEQNRKFTTSGRFLTITEPMRKGYKPPKVKHGYSFKQTIKNLHSGRPAYSCMDASSCESTKITTELEDFSSGICELSIASPPPGKSRKGGRAALSTGVKDK